MHTAVMSVMEFHETMGLKIGDPRKPDVSVDQELRMALITEEVAELRLALEGRDKHGKVLTEEEKTIAVADALGDICYVVAGAAVTWGIDLGGCFDEIHRSNMTKTPGNKRVDGKILKGDNYDPPNLKSVLDSAAQETEALGTGEDSWWPLAPSVAAMAESTLGAMKEINRDFLEEILTDGEKQDPDFRVSHEPSENAYGGYFTRDLFVFGCPCGRQHTVATRQGSRGGWSGEGECGCLCGRHFTFEFRMRKGKEPLAVCTKEADLGKVG
jgi:predicted HAD superfamily Cof-like phosphohydrolase